MFKKTKLFDLILLKIISLLSEDNIDTCMHFHELEIETFFAEVFISSDRTPHRQRRPFGEKGKSADATYIIRRVES